MYYVGLIYARYAHRANKKVDFRHLPYTIPDYVRKHKSRVIFTEPNAFTIMQFKKSGNVVLAIEDRDFTGHNQRKEKPKPDDVW